MKIVIAGGGKVGEKLCAELSHANHDIIIIEKNQRIVEELINKYDVNGVVGNGASIEILQEVGMESTDIFIAVTEQDEINIIASVLAKRLGVKYNVARIRNPEYSRHHRLMQKSLGISLIVNPELETARSIIRILKYSSALSVESFAGERVNLVEIEIGPDSSLEGLYMKDFRRLYGSVLVCVIVREDGQVIIPKGDAQIQSGDRIHITGSARDMTRFMKAMSNTKNVHSTLIVGGGRIAYYLLASLAKTNIATRVIELNADRAAHLSSEYPQAEIIVADGTNHDILDEQGVANFDSFIALTGIDEENLVVSMYAQHQGVEKVITKMDRIRLLKLLEFQGIKSVVAPKMLVSNEIVQFVRALQNSQGSNVEALYRIAGDQVEALQFKVTKHSHVINQPIMDLAIRSDILIAYIVRDEELIFPSGMDEIHVGDRVIVVSKNTNLDDIDDILETVSE